MRIWRCQLLEGFFSESSLLWLLEIIQIRGDEIFRNIYRKTILEPQGTLLHSFWLGDKKVFIDGLRFRYYTEDNLLPMVEPFLEVLEINRYSELEEKDSIYLVLQKIWYC